MQPQNRAWGRGDDIGTWAPIGGGSGAKDLIKFPSEAEKLAPVAGTLIRSRILNEKLPGYYGLAASLIGNYEPGQAFIINMMAAGLGKGGFARNEYLMADVKMLVPTAMPTQHPGPYGPPHPPQPTKKQGKNGEAADE